MADERTNEVSGQADREETTHTSKVSKRTGRYLLHYRLARLPSVCPCYVHNDAILLRPLEQVPRRASGVRIHTGSGPTGRSTEGGRELEIIEPQARRGCSPSDAGCALRTDSSRNIVRLSPMRAIPTLSFRFIPPESDFERTFVFAWRPTSRIFAWTAESTNSGGVPFRTASRVRCSFTVRLSNRTEHRQHDSSSTRTT